MAVMPAVALLAVTLGACGSSGSAQSAATTPSTSIAAPSSPALTPPATPTPTPTAETTAEATTEAAPPVVETPPPPTPSEQSPAPQETTEAPQTPQTPQSGTGTYATANLDVPATAGGRVVRFAVQVEDGVPVDAMDFARQVLATLTDPRGWQGVDGIAFEATSDTASAAFIVTLATPATTDRLCYPLDTGGWLDCYNSRGRAVINSDRWVLGADSWGADLTGYRQMVVNHEVGHAIGHGHLYCPGSGQLAPVMQQQTISLQGCAPNAWPAATGG